MSNEERDETRPEDALHRYLAADGLTKHEAMLILDEVDSLREALSASLLRERQQQAKGEGEG